MLEIAGAVDARASMRGAPIMPGLETLDVGDSVFSATGLGK
jgi:hypothetical protein